MKWHDRTGHKLDIVARQHTRDDGTKETTGNVDVNIKEAEALYEEHPTTGLVRLDNLLGRRVIWPVEHLHKLIHDGRPPRTSRRRPGKFVLIWKSELVEHESAPVHPTE